LHKVTFTFNLRRACTLTFGRYQTQLAAKIERRRQVSNHLPSDVD